MCNLTDFLPYVPTNNFFGFFNLFIKVFSPSFESISKYIYLQPIIFIIDNIAFTRNKWVVLLIYYKTHKYLNNKNEVLKFLQPQNSSCTNPIKQLLSIQNKIVNGNLSQLKINILWTFFVSIYKIKICICKMTLRKCGGFIKLLLINKERIESLLSPKIILKKRKR